MVLLLGIALIILALIFFALRGFFGIFPDNWEWFGIVLAGAGIIMATPSIFQMLWGRPHFNLRFKREAEELERFLAVYIENLPIKSRMLKKMGIRRDTIQSLTVQFQLFEVGSGKKIIPIRSARIYSDDDPTNIGRWRISLPPTFSIAACIIPVKWDTAKNKAVVPPDQTKDEQELEPGQYRIDFNFAIDGEPYIISRQFVIGKKADDLTWVQSIPHK